MKRFKAWKKKIKKINIDLRHNTSLILAFFVVIICLFSLFSGIKFITYKLSYGEMLNTGYTEEVSSISFSSGTEEGDATITKEAEWVDKAVAKITLSFSSIAIPQYTNQDVILVLDTSLSMTEDRVESAQEAVKRFTEYLFSMGDNRVAFITFATNSTIKTGFTNDPDVVNTFMETLDVGGSTNYYDALKDVEEVLDGYTQRENTELHMVFITDGYPTEMIEYHGPQFEKIKNEYPYLEADSVAFELNNSTELKNISDYVYNASISSLSNILYSIVINSEYYDNFSLTDYIDTKYFEFVEESVSGRDYDNQSGRITFDFSNYKTGTGTSVSFKIKVKDEYLDTYGYFPTNKETSFVATVPTSDDEISASTTSTPVLKSWYDLTYNANTPLGCGAEYDKVVHIWPFDKVYLDDTSLTCPNTRFDGWTLLTDDVTMIGSSSFVMPMMNVSVGGTWKMFSLTKRMEGTMYGRPKLYKYLSDNAVLSGTNDKRVYTLSNTTTNTYPVHYYKGDFYTNNNLLFGGYCWRIVRTTDTGGTMILFSGSPVDGICNNLKYDLMVSSLNNSENGSYSFLNSSYVYGAKYRFSDKKIDESNMLILAEAKGSSSYSYIYTSDSLRYGTSYTINSAGKFELSGDIDVGAPAGAVGKYVISLSDSTATSSSSLYYIYNRSSSKTFYHRFTTEDYDEAGEEDIYTYFYNKASQAIWYYSNSVSYDSTNSLYKLENTIEVNPLSHDNCLSAINGDIKYRYTCFSNSKECSEVYFILMDDSYNDESTYIILNDGKNFEEAYDAVIENPTDINDSAMKTTIEDWYANTSGLLNYKEYIEDANYCNNRKVRNKGVLDINSKTTNTYSFKAANASGEYTECREVDVVNVANGKLNYPIFFLTADEANMIGGNSYLSSDIEDDNAYTYSYWLTGIYSNSLLYGPAFEYSYLGSLGSSKGLRPIISLGNNVHLAGGDGSAENPFTVSLG